MDQSAVVIDTFADGDASINSCGVCGATAPSDPPWLTRGCLGGVLGCKAAGAEAGDTSEVVGKGLDAGDVAAHAMSTGDACVCFCSDTAAA